MSNLEVKAAPSPDRSKFQPGLATSTTAIIVDPSGTFSSGSEFSPSSSNASSTTTITLQSSSTSSSGSVHTFKTVANALVEFDALTPGSSPYSAPQKGQTAASYSLSSAGQAVTTVTLSTSSTPSLGATANGTINVGGTGGGGDGNDGP